MLTVVVIRSHTLKQKKNPETSVNEGFQAFPLASSCRDGGAIPFLFPA